MNRPKDIVRAVVKILEDIPVHKAHSTPLPASPQSNDEWLKAQCNRYVNGQCSTLTCLKRGGYVRGTPPNYDTATCEPHEILTELAALRADTTKE